MSSREVHQRHSSTFSSRLLLNISAFLTRPIRDTSRGRTNYVLCYVLYLLKDRFLVKWLVNIIIKRQTVADGFLKVGTVCITYLLKKKLTRA